MVVVVAEGGEGGVDAYCATKRGSNKWTYGAQVRVHNEKARGVHARRTLCLAPSGGT